MECRKELIRRFFRRSPSLEIHGSFFLGSFPLPEYTVVTGKGDFSSDTLLPKGVDLNHKGDAFIKSESLPSPFWVSNRGDLVLDVDTIPGCVFFRNSGAIYFKKGVRIDEEAVLQGNGPLIFHDLPRNFFFLDLRRSGPVMASSIPKNPLFKKEKFFLKMASGYLLFSKNGTSWRFLSAKKWKKCLRFF